LLSRKEAEKALGITFRPAPLSPVSKSELPILQPRADQDSFGAMNRARYQLQPAVCGVLLLFSMSLTVSAQESLATMQLEDVRLKGRSTVGLLREIALQYDIPIGFERAMNSDSISHKEMRIRSSKITLNDLLTQIMAEHTEYLWEISDGVVHVRPREGHRDPIVERLLNVEIKEFSVEKGTVTWDVEHRLLKAPEFKSVVDDYGLSTFGFAFSGFQFPQLGRNYTLVVSDTKVRSILDRIVKESPTAKFWSINRDSREHTFSIGLAALQEGLPKHLRRVDFEELELLSYPIP
jgi:hypothetical protein